MARLWRWSVPVKNARCRSRTRNNSSPPPRLSVAARFSHCPAEIGPDRWRLRCRGDPCGRPAWPTASAGSRATTRVAPTFLRLARNWIDASPGSCRERPYFGLCLRVRELAEFDLHTSRDGGHFVTGLEAGEIRPVLPRPWATELHAGLDGGVVHDVDLALVVRIALLVAGEIPEIAARGKDRVHPRNLGDLVGILEAFQRLDHQDQHYVVVDGVPVAAGHVTPHVRIEGKPAAETALTQRRKIGPVARRNRLFHGVYGWDDDDQCPCIESMLNLKLIRIRHARSRHRFGIWAGPPRLADLVPGVVGVLHLGPDKVVPGVRHGAVSGRIDPGRHGAAHKFAAGQKLDLGWIPHLGPGRRRKSVAVLPGV